MNYTLYELGTDGSLSSENNNAYHITYMKCI